MQAFAGWMLQHGALFDADTPGFSQLHAQAAELLQDPRVDTNSTYWSTLQRLVLLGQLDTAMTLLAHHPVFQASQDDGMANLVGKMLFWGGGCRDVWKGVCTGTRGS
jgi:hypothetical protein